MDRKLESEMANCRVCAGTLPLGPRPVFRLSPKAKILIVGQAPGTRVHETGVPWNDPSGDRLRSWLGTSREEFYDSGRFSIVPTGLCYPGKGKSGDLPPRPECAPMWMPRVIEYLDPELVLLIGIYAQKYFLAGRTYGTLTDTVKAWREYLPKYFVLPHPSPRNFNWFRTNPWFEEQVVPELRRAVAKAK